MNLLIFFVVFVSPASASRYLLQPTNEQVFTLGIVVASPNINDDDILELINETVSEVADYENATLRFTAAMSSIVPFRLLLNPVYITGRGLDKVIQKLFCSHESRGTNAVFFLIDQQSSSPHFNTKLLMNFMSTLINYVGLPTIAWSTSIADMEQSENREELPLVLLAPSVRAQAAALYGYTKRYLPMRKISLLVSSRAPGVDYFINKLRELASIDDDGIRSTRFDFDSHQHHMSSRLVHIVRLDHDTFKKELIFLRDNTDTRVFIVYADPGVLDKVMEEAHLLGMTSGEHNWLCAHISFTESVPPNYPPGLIVATYNTTIGQQRMALKAAIRVWSEAVRRFVNLSLPSENIMPTISCSRFKTAKWNYNKAFHNLLQQRLTRITAPDQDNLFAVLNDITFTTLEMSRHWRQIGGWTATKGPQVDEKWLRRFDHANQVVGGKSVPLRIVTLDEPPFIIYDEINPVTGHCPKTAVYCRLSKDHPHRQYTSQGQEYEHFFRNNATNVCCSGYIVDLLRKLSYDIGFQFELFEVPDGKWGTMDQLTGQWNGLIHAVLNGTADIVATSLKINTERSSAIDFSIPFYQTGVTILVRVREGAVSSVAFLEPFSFDTWLIIFVGCVNACAFSIFLCENLRRCIFPQEDDDDFDNAHRASSLFGAFWLVLSMLTNASVTRDIPKSISGRFVVNVWAFFCVIFMSSFMANLAAFMITKEEYFDLSGLDDFRLKNPFTKNPPWKFGTIPFGATEQLIRSNYPEMHQYMRKYMRRDVDAGVEAVLKEDLDAFIYDASVLTYKAGREKDCRLKTVGKWYAPTGYGFGFPKSSKWIYSINKHLLDYQISGYLQHLEDYWLSSSCKQRFAKQTQKSTVLGIANLAAVFGLLAGAICICGLFFAFEHFIVKRCNTIRLKRRRRNSAWRFITPSLGKTISFSKTARAAFSQSKRGEIKCHNPACRIRQRFLQQQLFVRKERLRFIEEKMFKGSIRSPLALSTSLLPRPRCTSVVTASCSQRSQFVQFSRAEDEDTVKYSFTNEGPSTSKAHRRMISADVLSKM